MSARRLLNARMELFALMLMCDKPEVAGKMLLALPSMEYFATSWAREAYKRVRERYQTMEVSEGALNFTSLVSDDHLSESTRERLESGRRKFKDEKTDAAEIIKTLTHYRQLRRINELSEHINEALQGDDNTPLDASSILTDIEEHVAATRGGNSETESWFFHVGTGDNMSPVLKRIYSDTERSFVPTGIDEFDKRNGGFNYGSLVLIVGTTGGGKTLVAQNVLQNMAMYEDVALVTLEMSEEEQVSRMLAREGRVNLAKISSKHWNEEEKQRALDGFNKFRRKVKKQGNRFTIVRPDREVSAEDVITLLHPYNYRVIGIDYAGLLEGADGDDQVKALGRIGRALKVYAANTGKVIILLAQGNEEGKTRYARALMEHANNMWAFVATQHTKEQGIIEVDQPKARNQDPTPMTLEVEYEFMNIAGDSASKVKDDDDAEAKTEKSDRKPTGSAGRNNAGRSEKAKPSGKKYLDNVRDL